MPVRQQTHLVGRIYDAAHGVIHWDDLAKSLVEALGGTTAFLVVQDRRLLITESLSHHAIPAEAMAAYARHYATQDLWVNAIRSGKLYDRVLLGHEIVPTDVYDRSVIYNELSRRHDITYALAAILRLPTIDFLFGAHRRRAQGLFDRSNAGMLRTLLPHLAHALAGRQLVGEPVLAARASQAVLDALDKGIVHIGVDGSVVQANRAAESIFRRNDGLRCLGSRVLAERQADNDALQRLISRARTSTSDGSHRAGGYVRIARAETDAFYVVAAFPIEVDRISGNLRTPSVCLVIGSSERRRRVTAEALVDVLELTPGEARVAAALANGENLISISQQLGIAHNTARALLARVFQKTNTSSQTGLLALILNCIPTL